MAPTVGQLTRKLRVQKLRNPKSRWLGLAPHRKGIIYKIAIMSPRKPNSARRTIAKVRLSYNEKRIFAKIPGIGEHKLQAHSLVFVRGHGPKDSPGINYHLVRGLCDFTHAEVFGRRSARSKYGLKSLKNDA
jgi:small subunit ribosomal protein S12